MPRLLIHETGVHFVDTFQATVASLLANGKLRTAEQGGSTSTTDVAATIAAAIEGTVVPVAA